MSKTSNYSYSRFKRSLDVQRAKSPKTTMIRIWSYLKSQRLSLLLTFFVSSLSSLLILAGPYLVGYAIDVNIIKKDLYGLSKTIGLMIFVYLTSTFFNWLQTYMMIGISQKAVKQIRYDAFSKLESLSLSYFDKTPHGDIMSRLINDIQNISRALSQSLIQMISGILTLVGVIIVMFRLNWRMAVVVVFVIPVIFFLIGKISRRTRESFKKQQKNLGTLNSFIEEKISGQKVIKTYGIEGHITDQFDSINEEYKKSAIKAQIYSGIMGPFMNAIKNFNFALVVGLGGMLNIMGYATPGNIASFVSYSRRFSRPLNQIASLYNTIQSAIAGAERVFELMDESPNIKNTENPLVTEQLSGNIEFKNVNFGYGNENLVLKDISFKTRPGEIIALVGPTGSGKTTIASLINRFYDVTDGQILIDERDIREYEFKNLRRKIGVVLQDTFLFSGSVRDNIAYSKPNARLKDIVSAAKFANAHNFIKRLPDGYDTILSEDASNLSHGQKQLISIARTILSNPDVIILDEATSSVDTRTELKIQNALYHLMQGRTSFVIAHRLKTIQKANRILVVRYGEIVEHGSHKELMDMDGFYSELYQAQFKGLA